LLQAETMRYHTAWQGVIEFIKRPHLHWFDISTLNHLSKKTIRHDPWGTDPPSTFFARYQSCTLHNQNRTTSASIACLSSPAHPVGRAYCQFHQQVFGDGL